MTITPLLLLDLLFKYGPIAVAQAQQIAKWIADKKETVTDEDFAVLIAYGQQKGAEYFQPAPPLGIVPPPPAP